jgi:hypothetical protein
MKLQIADFRLRSVGLRVADWRRAETQQAGFLVQLVVDTAVIEREGVALRQICFLLLQ